MLTSTEHAAPPIGPTQPEERIAVLDILRGFALLGILIINMPGFNLSWGQGPSGLPWYSAPIDRATEWLINFLGSGKFNATFSFLFGVGFTLQMARAEARGAPFVTLFLRRLAALLIFGLAHLLLLWEGDVLHVYALLGVPLMLLRRIPDRWLFALFALLILAPIARDSFKLYVNEPEKFPASYWSARADEDLRVFGRGSYLDMVKTRARHTIEGYLEHGEGWFIDSMGATMLLGLYAGRRRILQDLPAHLPWIRRLMVWALGLGVTCALVFATSETLADRAATRPTLLELVSAASYELNRPLMSLFYISAIVLLSRRAGWSERLAPLATVGRMPLTNYLMQSVICTTLFYSYGLGLFGKVRPSLGLLLSLAIFLAQVAYSRWWMARFRFGPMEWLWRTLTYGRAPAMRGVP